MFDLWEHALHTVVQKSLLLSITIIQCRHIHYNTLMLDTYYALTIYTSCIRELLAASYKYSVTGSAPAGSRAPVGRGRLADQYRKEIRIVLRCGPAKCWTWSKQIWLQQLHI